MARTLAWAVAVVAAVVAAQTLPKAHAESTDARNALTLALPNTSTATTNASTTACDVIVRIGYPEGLAPYAVAAPTRWLDGSGACFAFYRHQTGQRALEKLEGGDLDMAIFGSSVFGLAVERGAKITFAWSDHIVDTVEGLVARCSEPQALRGKTILVPQYSTAHYQLLAFLEGVAIDAADITIEFADPAEIMHRWTLGTIDGAACWTSCFDYLLAVAPGGGDTPGTLLYDAQTLARWGYAVGGTLVARNEFLDEEPALVQRVVSRFARANADYVRDPRAAGWGAGGSYSDLVGRFYTLDLGEAATMPFPVVERYLGGLRYRSLETQLNDLSAPESFRRHVEFFYEQKTLAEKPYSIYQPGLYDRFLKSDCLRGALPTEEVPLDAAPDALPAFVANAVPAQLTVPGEGCAPLTVLDGAASFSDGSTGTNAYQPNAICVWALRSPTGCVALDVTFLYSEGSDKLEVFSSSGDLLVALSGRLRRRDDAWNTTIEGCFDDATSPPPGVDDVSASLYVRWTTDAHDEQAIGAIEPVGFEASTREITAARNDVCPPGWSGTRCDAPHCVGVVDVVGDRGTIASQTFTDAYNHNSRCGWRIAAKGQRVVVDITRLGMERVHDSVAFYRGLAAPPGFGLPNDWSPASEVYTFRNGRRPDGPLVFDHDVFIAFATDGVGNAPRDGGNAGLELHWRLESADAPLCDTIRSCGAHGTCVDGACRCDPGYYGKLCVFDSCRNRAEQPLAESGHILSGATDDYEPATNCGWIIDIKGRPGVRITGIRLHIDKFDLEVAEGFATTTDSVTLGVRARGELGPALLAIFRGERGQMGERVVSVARPADPLTSPTPNYVVTLPFVYEDYAEDAYIPIELPAWLPAELIPEVGAGLELGLRFESDANNPEPFSGFEIGYAPLYDEGKTYCDGDHWPCASDQECGEDNLCVKKTSSSSKSRAGKKFKRVVTRVAIGLAIAIGVVVAALGAYYARRVVEQKDALEAERAHVVRDQCDEARRAVEDFQAPFCVIPADAFCALGALRPHEELRDGRRLDDANAVQLEFFDGLRDVEAARSSGAVMVFLSHQWLGTRHPDPAGMHYRAMCAALRSVADDAKCELSAIRAWVDVISIPQANLATQSLAVSSLPAYASCVDYFIVCAPSVTHADTGLACDSTTYRKRAWCRAEVVSCWARRGSRRMYVSTNQGLRSLFGHGSPGQPDAILLECLRVFQGDLTCCSLGHPDGDECDFEALVQPAIGMLGELYRDRHERPGAWALLKDRLDELFPHTFTYRFESGASAEFPLFGDLAKAMIRIVDHEEKKGNSSPEQLLRGLAPGTSGQRHSPLGRSPQHRLVRTATRHSPPSSGARSRSRLDLFRSPSAVLRGLSTRTTVSDSTGGGTAEPISLAPDDDLWANSPPGSRTNASTPREVSWTDPEAVERRHITLQPTLPKTPSQEQRGHVHV